ncbi:MAG: RecX family transcriptional regulator [Labilithrix sp.]|nr:RecX family transcriptional regulator [Labilithrix sp.]MCW5811430.1 RecX family transcriptional regulator [Labilithrix sp.]
MTPPTQAAVHEWALAYLTNRPASVAEMRRVLARRIDGWARRARKAEVDAEAIEAGAHTARERAEAVIERLQASGLLDDVTYAKHRAERLAREGKSRRAVSFDLAKRGIASELARASIDQDPATELAAAASLLRKKRIGAFSRKATAEIDARERQRWLGALARAGYSFSTAERALRLDREAAEELLRSLR